MNNCFTHCSVSVHIQKPSKIVTVLKGNWMIMIWSNMQENSAKCYYETTFGSSQWKSRYQIRIKQSFQLIKRYIGIIILEWRNYYDICKHNNNENIMYFMSSSLVVYALLTNPTMFVKAANSNLTFVVLITISRAIWRHNTQR